MADVTLDDLDPAAILQAESFLATFLKEQFPSMDTSEGRVLRELLIRPAAIFHVLEQTDINNLRLSMSLKAISENPTLADEDQVDAVLSNFRLTRDAGVKAAGQVTIVIRTRLTTAIAAGTIFTINSVQFKTTTAFVGVTTQEAADINPDTQRLIIARSDSKFSFVVDVEAVSAGAISKVRRNAAVSSVSPSPAGFISAYATQDFSDGTSTQTNEEFVLEAEGALSPQVLSGRTHIASTVMALIPTAQAVSTIGFGDGEMIRDRHNIFNVSHGGKADIYVKTSVFPESQKLSKTATLINAGTKLWQVEIGRDDAPGFYRVEAVLAEGTPQTGTSLELVSVVKSLNLVDEDNGFVPEVVGLIEGGFTSYQTAIVQFKDPNSDITAVSPAYDVYVQGMPYLKTVQDRVNNRGFRNPQADYLVKAPVPAFLALEMEVQYANGFDAPDEDAIKQSIVSAVNNINFKLGRLPISIIHDAVHNVVNEGTMVKSPMDMICRIHKPTGEIIETRSSETIVIPDLPLEGVTSRTTAFMISVDDIDLAVSRVPVLPV